MSHACRDSDENDHDNGCQSDHERSHRTIQQAMTSRAAQARHARAIDAGLPPSGACALDESEAGRLNSDSVGPLWPLSCDSRSFDCSVYSVLLYDYSLVFLRPDNCFAVAVSLPLAIALRAIAVHAAFALAPLRSRSHEFNA